MRFANPFGFVIGCELKLGAPNLHRDPLLGFLELAMSALSPSGILLFAHGASDPGWAEPFQAIRQEVLELRPNTPVALAFLEKMSPDFSAGVAQLHAQGCTQIEVYPLFLARGAHLKSDLPRLVAKAASQYPELQLALQPALGEIPAITRAIAKVVANGLLACASPAAAIDSPLLDQ